MSRSLSVKIPRGNPKLLHQVRDAIRRKLLRQIYTDLSFIGQRNLSAQIAL